MIYTAKSRPSTPKRQRCYIILCYYLEKSYINFIMKSLLMIYNSDCVLYITCKDINI